MEKPANLQSTWFIFGAFFLSTTMVVLVYSDTILAMVKTWYGSETYNHCFFIVPVFVYFVWNKRFKLHGLPEPSLLGLLPVAALGFLWLLGAFADVSLVKQFAVVGMIVTATAAWLGVHLARQIAFPLGFLFLSVPIGEEFLPVMMDFTASFTVTTLKLLGFPVFREGNFFSLPSGNWSVVEACSGVRYLIASVTMGLIYAYITYTRFYKRFVFVLVSIIVPIIANGLRAVLIVLLGHYSGMTIATGVDHLIYGWLFFGVIVFILFWLGSYWRDDMGAATDEVSLDLSEGTADLKRWLYNRRRFRVTGLLLIVLLLWPIWFNWSVSQGSEQLVTHQLPVGDGYAECRHCLVDFKPGFNHADHYSEKSYETKKQDRADKPMYVFIASYYSWNPKSELIAYQNQLIKPADENHRIISQGEKDAMIRTVSRGQQGRWLTYHWYQVVPVRSGEKPGRVNEATTTTSKIKVKVLEALNRLIGRHYISQVVAVYTPTKTIGDSEQRLRQFLSAEKDHLTQTSRFY